MSARPSRRAMEAAAAIFVQTRLERIAAEREADAGAPPAEHPTEARTNAA